MFIAHIISAKLTVRNAIAIALTHSVPLKKPARLRVAPPTGSSQYPIMYAAI